MSDKLKPSQLLRIGANQIKHIRWNTFRHDRGKIIGGCALAMMAVAKSGSLMLKDVEIARTEIWNALGRNIGSAVINRNDGKHQSPDQIADWLEGKGL